MIHRPGTNEAKTMRQQSAKIVDFAQVSGCGLEAAPGFETGVGRHDLSNSGHLRDSATPRRHQQPSEDTEPETWRQCADFLELEVSDLGRVRVAQTGRIVAQSTVLGYCRVVLRIGDRLRRARVHRLVARAFIPNDRPEAEYVNHIDGDKRNNRVGNLEWCTPLENARHAVALGLQPHGEAHGASKLKVEQVHRIRSMRSEGHTLRSIAKALGMSDTAVFRVVSGKTWARS